MRTVFVYPSIQLSGRYKEIIKGVALPPQGICQIAAVTRELGHETSIIDAMVLGLSTEETIDRVLSASPECVGFSSTTMQIHQAAEIANALKERNPEIHILLGGPHASAVPEETLADFGAFDVAVMGEGEYATPEILAAFEKKHDLQNVTGIAFREGNLVRITPPRPFIKNLDDLPMPAWDLLPDMGKFYQQSVARIDALPAASITTSRGCPYRCIFCSHSVYGASYRFHSVEYVQEMIHCLVDRYHIRSIAFEDENFTASKKRLREICGLFTQSRNRLTWTCASRVDTLNADDLALMKQAGCTSISFGIESGNQPILDLIGKRLTKEKIVEGVGMTDRAGIRARGYFIIGHPTETIDTINETREFMKELDLSEAQVSYMCPFPGTQLAAEAHKYGTFDSDWRNLNIWTPVFIPNGLDRDILEAESKRMMREFFFRPRIICRFLRRMTNPRYWLKYAKDALNILSFLVKK